MFIARANTKASNKKRITIASSPEEPTGTSASLPEPNSLFTNTAKELFTMCPTIAGNKLPVR